MQIGVSDEQMSGQWKGVYFADVGLDGSAVNTDGVHIDADIQEALEDYTKEAATAWNPTWVATFTFLTTLFGACLNVGYIVYAWDTSKERDQSWEYIYKDMFRISSFCVTWVELVVVLLHFVRILIDIPSIWVAFSGSTQARHIWVMAENIKMCSAFSVLRFIPTPPKLKLWFENRNTLWYDYVAHPTASHGVSILECGTPKALFGLETRNEHFHDTSLVTKIFLAIILLYLQILQPLCMLFLPVLGTFGFAVKASSVPFDAMSTWGFSDWLVLLGFINQTSNMFDVKWVMQRAATIFCFYQESEPLQVAFMGSMTVALIERHGELYALSFALTAELKEWVNLMRPFCIFVDSLHRNFDTGPEEIQTEGIKTKQIQTEETEETKKEMASNLSVAEVGASTDDSDAAGISMDEVLPETSDPDLRSSRFLLEHKEDKLTYENLLPWVAKFMRQVEKDDPTIEDSVKKKIVLDEMKALAEASGSSEIADIGAKLLPSLIDGLLQVASGHRSLMGPAHRPKRLLRQLEKTAYFSDN